LRQQILRQHGAFSIDREGTDLAALRKAREILQHERYPLAIFPEGEVYHLNERLTPFREGPAAIGVMAARKGSRPVACVPCAMRYYYVQDPTRDLCELMNRLEESLHWRPRRDLSLPQRIYHLAEGALALKEVEIMGQTSTGCLPQRIQSLIEFVLGRVECRHDLCPADKSVPERVKAARHELISKLESLAVDDPQRAALMEELDVVFLVVQAFSYPGDYVSENPSIERIAETLDKFEEDLLGVKTATIRGGRRAVVTFGEPIIVPTGVKHNITPRELTQSLQDRVAELLHAEE
jgi:1-acyl-sn-glycerol-3-phosphate acyltransferase